MNAEADDETAVLHLRDEGARRGPTVADQGKKPVGR